jgi:hypothetical protein
MKSLFAGTLFLCLSISLTIAFGSTPARAAGSTPGTVTLARSGKADLPIIISARATPTTRELAETLAAYLQKISGAKFEIQTGDSSRGIALGTAQEFPKFATRFKFTPETREDYLLQSHARGVNLIGAGPLGVRHVMWDFLYRLGYRQFFPGENWEIIPRESHLKIAVDVQEHPDFLFRRIWSGSGSWPENEKRWNRWNEIHRMEGGIVLNTSHSWNLIYKEFQDEFLAHPEYFALLDGKRQVDAPHKKFCISNAGLRDLVGRYALDFFAKNLQEETVSIDPSDFGGWCRCDECLALGTPSDREVILANQTVHTVRAKYPDKYVAFYAYNEHSPPPSVKIAPGVIVSVATGFIRGEFSFEELVQEWRKQGAEIGVRDYMSVIIWDFDLPNESKAGQLDGLPLSLKKYHDLGARFYIAEGGDSWGANGLGYYLASRILWDVTEADRVDELFADFIAKSFPDAQQPMREFYQLLTGIEHANGLPLNRSYLGRLYAQLDTAWKMTKNASVRARLGDLVLYLSSVEKYLVFREAISPAERQNAFEALMRHAYRIRDSHMVYGSWYYRRGFHQDFIKLPSSVGLKVDAADDPWKSEDSYAITGIESILREGVTRNPVQAEKWRVQLAAPLAGAQAGSTLRARGKQTILLHALKDGAVQIATRMSPDSSQYLTPTYSITDLDGRLLQKGVLQSEQSITFPAKSGQSFLFNVLNGINDFTFSNAAAAYRTDLYRPLLPPGLAGLYFFRRGGTLVVYIPEGMQEWSLKLTTQAPGETAKVTVWDPQGKQHAVFQTAKSGQEKATLPGTAGFWRISFDRADSGALYKVFLSLDEQLAPWASVDLQHPLIVSRIKP